ncbi:MAG: hypothetical protein U9R25_06625 [Chloroflexota bacterium]|nr:hypothetical protein [Chloroflexota bacterium]
MNDIPGTQQQSKSGDMRYALLAMTCSLTIMVLSGCWERDMPITPKSTLQPTSIVTGLPVSTPDLRCIEDSDCVIAFRLDLWCDCGSIYSREQVEGDPNLLLVWERRKYPYTVPRTTRTPTGPIAMCKPCGYHPTGAICWEGRCKLPDNQVEMLRLCDGLVDQPRAGICYDAAAYQAFQETGTQGALKICRLQKRPDLEAACFSNIASFLAQTDAERANQLCKLIGDTTSITQADCFEKVRITSPTITPTPTATTTPFPTTIPTARSLDSPLPTVTPTPTSVAQFMSPLPTPIEGE